MRGEPTRDRGERDAPGQRSDDGASPRPGPGSAPRTPAFRVQVNVASGHVPDEGPASLLERGVRAVLERESVPDAEISLTLLDDPAIRDLNRRFLDRDRPTDVIAFPLFEPHEPVVGDVYVGVEQARRQAAELGISEEEELLRLAVHGTLHVLGYDHPEDEDRDSSEMYRIQEELLERVMTDRDPADRLLEETDRDPAARPPEETDEGVREGHSGPSEAGT